MSLKFGTSGLRGLVTEMPSDTVAAYTAAFLAACDHGRALCLGRDLRPSSPRIAGDVSAAARAMGVRVIDCGALPTPALALAAARAGASAIMVTGSHIPADRNGLKFYTPAGEITKTDETAILRQMAAPPPAPASVSGALEQDSAAAGRFTERYVQAFGPQALSDRRIGLYAHSAVGRDCLADILTGMGAEVIRLGWSDTFIPVDTEAVDADTRTQLRAWAAEHRLDALVSTDGDSDRPMLTDERGEVVPGDILGQITAQALGAEAVVTPISSNSGVARKGFETVSFTRIGSPFVIAGMQAATGRVVGYEANGGFLLGFAAQGPHGPLAPLLTRDCMLPIVVTLIAAGDGPLSARVAAEPAVFTAADRLQDVSIPLCQRLISDLSGSAKARKALLGRLEATEAALDLTDGVRMTLTGGAVVHLRPSGNAPELRLYVEADDRATAQDLLARGMALLQADLGQTP